MTLDLVQSSVNGYRMEELNKYDNNGIILDYLKTHNYDILGLFAENYI